ncbi:hypothetical protein ACGFZR_15245 [Streptomyces sp. NPDC048241]|uniref:hypothetical protein n=1 Tax=Streptomyces sp. NPDC048241 TaxID=3365521 RepID=UPI003724A866
MSALPNSLAKYASDLAVVTGTNRAASTVEFVVQLGRASYILGTVAGIKGGDALDEAANFIAASGDVSRGEGEVLMERALGHLSRLPQMVAEYRALV